MDDIMKLALSLEKLVSSIEAISHAMFENKKIYEEDRKHIAEALKTLASRQESFLMILQQAGILEDKKETIN